MQVTVLLFGPAAAALQRSRMAVSVSENATCSEVMEQLGASDPRLRPFLAAGSGRLAVNHAFAPADRRVSEHDELALIAMVSGG